MNLDKGREQKLSSTRGAPLWNLSALCRLLQVADKDIQVRDLANLAIKHGVFNYDSLLEGDRLPTRINHHIIALRDLELVDNVGKTRQGFVRLAPQGMELAQAIHELLPSYLKETRADYEWREVGQLQEAKNDILPCIREVWRSLLIDSAYVRLHWLKFFMGCENFSFQEFVDNASPIRLLRLSSAQLLHSKDNNNSNSPFQVDSGYRIISQHWPDKVWEEKHRREIYQGLRLWTNEAQLTDDAILEQFSMPFRHLTHNETPGEVRESFEFESHPVKQWLHPDKDVEIFSDWVEQILSRSQNGRQATLPELIIALCNDQSLSKENVKLMLTRLYYEYGKKYSFERGSRFLIENAFDLRNRNKPDVYYLKLDGIWRTGVVIIQ